MFLEGLLLFSLNVYERLDSNRTYMVDCYGACDIRMRVSLFIRAMRSPRLRTTDAQNRLAWKHRLHNPNSIYDIIFAQVLEAAHSQNYLQRRHDVHPSNCFKKHGEGTVKANLCSVDPSSGCGNFYTIWELVLYVRPIM